MVAANGRIGLDDRPEFAASTAAHELGHAVFEAPAWAIACRRPERIAAGGRRVFRRVTTDERHFHPAGPKNEEFWAEYRANEFMGGLLVPPDLLHRTLVMNARRSGVPLTNGSAGHAGKPGYPVIDGQRWNEEGQDGFLENLAETFGVSSAFIGVRLRKYRLVAGRQ